MPPVESCRGNLLSVSALLGGRVAGGHETFAVPDRRVIAQRYDEQTGADRHRRGDAHRDRKAVLGDQDRR